MENEAQQDVIPADAVPLAASRSNQTEGRRALLQHRSNQSRLIIKSGAIVDAIRLSNGWSDDETSSWLQREIGMSPIEASTITLFQRTLGDKVELIGNKRVQQSTIERLAHSDNDTRTEFFQRLALGAAVDGDFVSALIQKNAQMNLPTEDAAKARRQNAIESAGANLAATLVESLPAKAADLLELFDKVESYVWPKDIEDLQGEALDLSPVRSCAVELGKIFELLFGSTHAHIEGLIDLSLKNDLEASLAFAWYAIGKLGSGEFHRHEIERSSASLASLRPAIEFLAGHRAVAVPLTTNRTLLPFALSTLSFVDFGAGIGVTAISLQNAGFEPAALYESWIPQTMQDNRSDWPVGEKPSRKQLELLRAKNIDLLTAGSAWKPFSSEDGHGYDVFRQALELTESVRPRTFFFEVEASMIERGSERCRSIVQTGFGGHGYEIEWHTLSASNFGLAQEREISILVGAQSGIARPAIPVFVNPPQLFLPDVIGDLIEAKAIYDYGDDLGIELYRQWRELCDDKRAPPFFDERKDKNTAAWAELGIDFSYEASPQPKAMFPLTIDMMKRIQGFPQGWTVDGRKEIQEFAITSSIPPVVVKVLGLSIHSALTGEEFDTRAALDKPLRVKRPVKQVFVQRKYGKPTPSSPARTGRAIRRPHPVDQLRWDWTRVFGSPEDDGVYVDYGE
ncbi:MULTISPECIES: DNA cytosine methyltransferase [unclassified Rhizobium]|uniref:DNA cytosine methyltransferase n=1 Tax=unclassified Rhizobium TaxID=2613769 RepID=UPI001ADD04D1|nr:MULTISPECIES: DNA cytosine methyltransferase [unclassified Rhizobium]MBO9126923.1 DNA cytosine methyltransferase [Rhizobium sp. 16-488-2b]MBO9177371.1 DNA cytosine methyltransferase [Rhizobium sp. 16-488-2a]